MCPMLFATKVLIVRFSVVAISKPFNGSAVADLKLLCRGGLVSSKICVSKTWDWQFLKCN